MFGRNKAIDSLLEFNRIQMEMNALIRRRADVLARDNLELLKRMKSLEMRLSALESKSK